MNNFSCFLPPHWPEHIGVWCSQARDGDAKDDRLRTNFLNTCCPNKQLILCQQTHSANVAFVDTKSPPLCLDTDGLISQTDGLVLGVFSADCVPIFITNRAGTRMAVLHSGWRGTHKQILLNALTQLQKNSGWSIADLVIFIGPHIQNCCYAVGQEMQDFFAANCFTWQSGQLYLSLKTALQNQLSQAGLNAQQYSFATDCTHCNKDYFSFRRDKTAQRMLAFIASSANKTSV